MIYTGNNKYLKFDPYEPCPCHPEKKFKFCCYPKAKEKKSKERLNNFSLGRINYEMKRELARTDYKTCFAFDKESCQREIKKAHSIQRNRILNRISIDGHVYQFTYEVTNEGEGNLPKTKLKKESWNKVSTFFGFCDYHDTELFRPIEVRDYIGEEIQDFLFAFRALALEMHKKTRFLTSVRNGFEEDPRLLLDPGRVYLYRAAQLDVAYNLRNYEYFKENYESGNFGILKTIYRRLSYEVNFAASASFSVKFDLDGKQIVEPYNLQLEIIPIIFINIYPTQDGQSNIIMSYPLVYKSYYESYFNALEELSEEQFLEYLNFLIIEKTENVYFSPKYIESLNAKEKRSLEQSFLSTIRPSQRLELIIKGNYYNFNLFDPKVN